METPYKLTTRDKILKVAEAWAEQYSSRMRDGAVERVILKQLQALDLTTCSAEVVDGIIGNNSWTTIHCDQCQQEVDEVVVMCDPEREVCQKCLKKALKCFNTKE